MASAYASIFDWRSPIFSRVRASFGSSWMIFWYSRTALSYFFFSTYFWAAASTFSRSIATMRQGAPSARAAQAARSGRRKRRAAAEDARQIAIGRPEDSAARRLRAVADDSGGRADARARDGRISVQRIASVLARLPYFEVAPSAACDASRSPRESQSRVGVSGDDVGTDARRAIDVARTPCARSSPVTRSYVRRTHGHPVRPLPRALRPRRRSAVDAALAERLLAVALARGGDYADLFFEYRAAGGLVFDEGILKSASRGVSMGLGVRVQKGDATGYAYVEQLDWDAMKRAAETAAQIATRRRRPRRPSRLARAALPQPLRARPGDARRARASTSARSSSAPRRRRTRTTRASSRSRRASPRRSARSSSSRATARWRATSQPLVRFGVRVDRREGRQAAGGLARRRRAHDASATSRARAPSGTRSEAAQQAITMLDARGGARRDRWRSCSRRATAASSCTRRWATASRPTSTARARATTPARSATTVASELCTVVDDATLLQSRGSHQRRRRGQRAAIAASLIEKGKLVGYMHDRLSAEHYKLAPERQRPARELRLRADAAHDEHDPARRAARPGGDPARASSAASTRRSSAAGRSTSRTATSSSR